jgi:hypothetical protein
MVVGERVQSQAQTREFDEGYDRTFGTERSKERGVFVWDDKLGKMVRPWEKGVDETPEARHAPINCDRHYENVPSPIDGHVFRSRRDHQEYMKARGLAIASDYDRPGGHWDRAEAKRAEGFSSAEHRRARQELIGRRLYEIEKMPQKQYDRQVEEARRRRAARTQDE